MPAEVGELSFNRDLAVRGRMRLNAALGASVRVAVPNTCPSLGADLGHLLVVPRHRGFFDPALGLVLLA
jgi:hypothetical protein